MGELSCKQAVNLSFKEGGITRAKSAPDRVNVSPECLVHREANQVNGKDELGKEADLLPDPGKLRHQVSIIIVRHFFFIII